MSASPLTSSSPVSARTDIKPRMVRIELTLKSLLTVLAILAGVWLVMHALPVLLVLVAALMLASALNPYVAWLERRKVRRGFSIFLVFVIGASLVAVLAMLTVPTVIAQVKSVAGNESKIRETVAGYLEHSQATAILADDIRNVRYAELLKSSKEMLFAAGARGLEIVAYGFASIFLAFYMMLDRDRLRGALFAMVPRSHHIRLSRILLNLGTIVGGYIRGQLLTCLLMVGFILVLLLACGVPNALAIAVFGGVMDLLPYIGLFLTMAPAVLAAWGEGPAVTAIVFALMLAYEEFESRVLVPLVYGRALRLPSSVVLFSLIVGTTMGGLVGALLALPMAAAVLMLVEELRVELPGETMQPEDFAQQQTDSRSEREYARRAESMPANQAAAIAVEISGKRKKKELATEHHLTAAKKKDGSGPA